MSSRFIHNEFLSFVRINKIQLYGYAIFLFIHLLVGGLLGCFYFLAIVGSATVNIHIGDFV
jgi:hypothetical protein